MNCGCSLSILLYKMPTVTSRPVRTTEGDFCLQNTRFKKVKSAFLPFLFGYIHIFFSFNFFTQKAHTRASQHTLVLEGMWEACLYFSMRALESQLRPSCLATSKVFSTIWAILPVPSSLFFVGGVPCIIGYRLASSSVCIQGWPGSSDLPASTYQVLELQAWTTIPYFVLRIKLAFMDRALCILGKHSTFSVIYPAPGYLVLTVGVNYILWLWILCI